MLLCAATGFGMYRLGSHIFGIQGYQFSLDPKLSPAMHKAIKDAVFESYITALARLTESVKAACPALESISLERRANNSIYVAVDGMKPYVCIGSHVLTTAGALVSKDCFILGTLQNLPVITQKNILGKATITDEFKQWLLQLDPSVFALYDIIWADDYEICLTDKNVKRNAIMCSVACLPNENVRKICQRIIENKSMHAQGTAHKYFYTADIRFEKQIVLCSQKGGACNG